MSLVSKNLLYCLNKFGIKHVFGYSGGAALPILDGLYGQKNVQFIDTGHEQWAGHAAEGYSKSLGRDKPGVVISTSGPGVTNLITALQDAYNDYVPIVAISGQVGSLSIGTRAFQEVDAVGLSRPCCVWSTQITNADQIQSVFETAFSEAMRYQRPVLIDIPKDISSSKEIPISTSKHLPIKPKTKQVNKDTYQQMSLKSNLFNKMFQKSKKPVLIVGQGALGGGSGDKKSQYELLTRFIQQLNLLHCTTLMATGYCDESNPLNLKMLGMHGSVAANSAVHDSDLIIGLGCRFDDRIIGTLDSFGINARQAFKKQAGGIIAINNSSDIGLTIKPDLHIKANCEDFLDYVLNNLKVTKTAIHNHWIDGISKLHRDTPFKPEQTKEIGEVTIPDVLSNLDLLFKINKLEDVVVTTGVGCHQMMASQYLTWKKPFNFLTSGSLGTMGVGLPFAIGAALAQPDKPVFVIDGDGSFNMSYGELNTIRKLNLPIKVIVMNDARQQMVYMWQELFFDKRIIATENDNPDYLKLAEAHGIDSLQINNTSDISSVLQLAIESPGPVVVDARVKPSYCLPFVAPGKPLNQMIRSNPLQSSENMFDRLEVPS